MKSFIPCFKFFIIIIYIIFFLILLILEIYETDCGRNFYSSTKCIVYQKQFKIYKHFDINYTFNLAQRPENQAPGFKNKCQRSLIITVCHQKKIFMVKLVGM